MHGQGTGTRSAALLVFGLLSSHENYSWHYVSDPIVVLHCLFWWLLFSLSYCLPLDIDLSWKSSTLTLWQHAKWKLRSFSFHPGSPFLSSSLLQILYPLPMSVFSLTFCSGQAQKISSCDLNFQLCWWFSHACIQPLHLSWLPCRKDLDSELWFLLLGFILICISFVSASHQPPSHPARNPQVIQTSSISSQTLLFNHKIYS